MERKKTKASQQVWVRHEFSQENTETKRTSLAKSIDLDLVGPNFIEKTIKIRGLSNASSFITPPYQTVCIIGGNLNHEQAPSGGLAHQTTWSGRT